ncbi:hypothetical protein ACQZV8_14450 [Magnetococcales bacterium HHB-1]
MQNGAKQGRFWFLMVLLGVLLSGCATPGIKMTVLRSAEFAEAAQLRRVAVLPFAGRGGRALVSEVESLLLSINLKGKPHFTLVERNQLDKVTREISRSNADFFFDNTNAVKIGKLTNARGIYTGRVHKLFVRQREFYKTETRCLKRRQLKKEATLLEQALAECVQEEHYSVTCIEREAVFEFTPKLIRVESGEIVYSRRHSGRDVHKGCPADGFTPRSKGEMRSRVIQQALAKFRKDIAPYFETITIRLMDGSGEENLSSTASERLKQGLEFANKRRLDRACELWGEGLNMAPNSFSLLYNLGACHEHTGRLDKAEALYRRADRQLTEPHEQITKALLRVARSRQDQKRLKKQIDRKQ